MNPYHIVCAYMYHDAAHAWIDSPCRCGSGDGSLKAFPRGVPGRLRTFLHQPFPAASRGDSSACRSVMLSTPSFSTLTSTCIPSLLAVCVDACVTEYESLVLSTDPMLPTLFCRAAAGAK